MIYLDTHVVVWLFDKRTELFTQKAIDLIENHMLLISPIVTLELQYLYEISKINDPAAKIVTELGDTIDLEVCDTPFEKVVRASLEENWTRDPFDRLIVAHAKFRNTVLLSKDRKIRSNYARALWE